MARVGRRPRTLAPPMRPADPWGQTTSAVPSRMTASAVRSAAADPAAAALQTATARGRSAVLTIAASGGRAQAPVAARSAMTAARRTAHPALAPQAVTARAVTALKACAIRSPATAGSHRHKTLLDQSVLIVDRDQDSQHRTDMGHKLLGHDVSLWATSRCSVAETGPSSTSIYYLLSTIYAVISALCMQLLPVSHFWLSHASAPRVLR